MSNFNDFDDVPRTLGPWLIDRGRLTLYDAKHDYEIDLEDCTTSAKVLDWIMQIGGTKCWADDACVAGLVRAFHQALRPQANLCSGGGSKTMTRLEIARSVDV